MVQLLVETPDFILVEKGFVFVLGGLMDGKLQFFSLGLDLNLESDAVLH
jgi:hypothetical protein